MNMFRKNKKGFTLIELIVVIAILAILAAIAIPTFIGVTDNAKTTVALANARTLVSAINVHNTMYSTNTPGYTKPIKDTSTLKADLADLWPPTLSDTDATAAINKISIDGNGVASIKTS